jgi:primosomal protein N'
LIDIPEHEEEDNTMKECKHCGHTWMNRKPEPRNCPKCKSYFYMDALRPGYKRREMPELEAQDVRRDNQEG